MCNKLIFITTLLILSLLSQTVYSVEIKTEQWVSIPVFGPKIGDILVKGGDSNSVYITTAYGEVFKTVNGGLDWECRTGLSRCKILAEDSLSETIYLGMTKGLFKSIDHGKSLFDIGGGILKDVSWIKVIDPMKIYVLSGGKLYKTLNGGKSWRDISPPEGGIDFVDIDAKSERIYVIPGIYYRIANAGIVFYSDDGGLKWQKKLLKASVLEHERKYYDIEKWIDLRIHPLNNKLFFAWGQVDGWRPHLVRSFDSGNTWKEFTPTVDNIKFIPPRGYIYGFLGNRLNFDINDESTFYITCPQANISGGVSNGFLKSTDGGRTYEFLQIDKDMRVYNISSTTSPLILYAATPQGVYKTIDGGKDWKPINIGLPYSIGSTWVSLGPETFVIYQIIVIEGQQWDTTVYKSEDGGLSWKNYYSYKVAPPIRLITTLGQKEYLLKDRAIAVKEIDSSEWKEIKTNVSHPLFFSASKSKPQNLYLIGEGKLYLSEDEGFSWTSVELPGPAEMADMREASGNNVIFLLTSSKFFRSEDRGKHWIDISLPKGSGNINTFAVDPISPNIIFAGTKGLGTYKTKDGGKTWNFVGKGLEDFSINCIAIDSKNPNIIYAGTDKGIFRSQDGGDSWELFNNGLPDSDRDIKIIRVNNSTPQLIVLGTKKGNIFRLMDSTAWDSMKKKWETLWKK